jgi:hypothetical protein
MTGIELLEIEVERVGGELTDTLTSFEVDAPPRMRFVSNGEHCEFASYLNDGDLPTLRNSSARMLIANIREGFEPCDVTPCDYCDKEATSC